MDKYINVKEEIKNVCDIVELIGQFVQLKKVGKNYIGLCPFHSEKDPSFTVSPDRQIFHCFGCKKGGDIFTFWMEYHNVSFFEAVKDLAERYNVNIKGIIEKADIEERDKIFEINEIAASFFKRSLWDLYIGKKARVYLKNRGINENLAKEIGLGYAPDKWDSLYIFLLNKGVNIKLGINSGLIIPRDKENACYDRFRDRLIFPIFDIRGRIVGFGGRAIDNNISPKYINTPETSIFRKGNLLYGLNFSYKAIRELKKAIIVEGYMDWLTLKKFGINHAVATLGTALTTHHVRRLKGYADEALVIFDSDEAGKKAALRSFPLFANEGLPAKIVLLPDGHDPDSYLNSYGRSAFLKLLDDTARSIFDFYLDMEIGNTDLKDEQKADILKNILPNLSYIKDNLKKGIYVSKLSERLKIREDLLWRELKDTKKKDNSSIKEKIKEDSSAKIIGDLQFLSLVIFHPSTVPRLVECNSKVLLHNPIIKDIVEVIFQKFLNNEDISPEIIHDELQDEEKKAFFREFLQKPFVIYEEYEVEQALVDIEKKAKKKMLLESIKNGKGDIKKQNELIKILRGGL